MEVGPGEGGDGEDVGDPGAASLGGGLVGGGIVGRGAVTYILEMMSTSVAENARVQSSIIGIFPYHTMPHLRHQRQLKLI